MQIKNGRIALKHIDDRFIISPESSKAILLLKLFQKSIYFPQNPFSISKRKLKKLYRLELLKSYDDENGNAIDIIDFKPKGESELLFSGQVWINLKNKQLIKINLETNSTKIQPFKLINRQSTILNVDLNISISFRENKQRMVFNHIDFNYCVKNKTLQNQEYIISTSAFLQAYDYENVFHLPKFNFSEDQFGDYRKINAVPYNESFWDNMDEFRPPDLKNKNKIFFNEEAELTSKTLFRSNSNIYMKGGLLEYPYIIWNGDRVWFAALDVDSSNISQNKDFTSSLYKLTVKLFADLYKYHDSIQLISATILDPLESYYKLSKDKVALCFINMYFDLMELQHREFRQEFLNSDKSQLSFDRLYTARLTKMEEISKTYLKDVQHGTNTDELIKWNDLINKKLGINNVKIFGLN